MDGRCHNKNSTKGVWPLLCYFGLYINPILEFEKLLFYILQNEFHIFFNDLIQIQGR